MPISDYDRFAQLFDQDWSSFSPKLFPALMRLVSGRITAGAKVLDLCCGSGRLARLLGDCGYFVTGIDNSPGMLKLAKANAPRGRFVLADARSFRLGEIFAAVFSTYDSLNHLLYARELQIAFRNVCGCLQQGGRFIFDLNTEQGFREEWQGYFEVREGKDYFYVNRASYDPKTRLGQTHCSLFRQKGKAWQRSEIRLNERCYRVSAVESWLKGAGFEDVRKYSLDKRLKLQRFSPAAPRVLFNCGRA